MPASQTPTIEQRPLAGERVAFTGRLASMTRAEADALLVRQGALPSRSVTHSTSLLVVGEDGWPLQRNGRLTHNLQVARQLQQAGQAIAIIREDLFLDRLDLGTDAPAGRRYSLLELGRVLGVSRERIRCWVRAGLIEPIAMRGHIPCFDFRQVSRARGVLELVQSGLSLLAIRRSLCQIRRWLPEAAATLDRLTRLERSGGRLAFETSRGDLMEPGGQLLLPFADSKRPAMLTFAIPKARDDLFEQAIRCEEQGRLHAAAEVYHQLLAQEGPDAEVCFNLANLHYALGDNAAAIERYRQAVELDTAFVEAWSNLGNVLAESGRHALAVTALRNALAIEPDYADAHYGLADALDEIGQGEAARPHWEAYLGEESTGAWADHARQRLADTSV